MTEEKNQYQIVRKDARNCFVESLNDSFEIGRIHLGFSTYDLNKPVGKRQTNNIHIYITVDEFLELCRKLTCGELRFLLQKRKENNDDTPIFQSLGGTSAEKLARQNRARADGMSLSRTVKLIRGKADFLLVADSGPGATNDKGLIVPRFGSSPENHVAVSMTFETLSELLLVTKTHYEAWLSAWYIRKPLPEQTKQPAQAKKDEQPQTDAPASEYNPDEII